MTAYGYRPLGQSEYRVLEMHPEENTGDRIHCSLRHCSLDDTVAYEALSYCWGPRSDHQPAIWVAGCVLPVTHNLYAALLRLRTQRHTIWIDAVCINQADTDERTQQVLQMRRIYAQASQVIIWLGEPDGRGAEAMRTLQKLVILCSRFEAEARPWKSDFPNTDEINQAPRLFFEWLVRVSLETYEAQIELYHGIACLGHFLAAPWFSRVWVVQELAVSKYATMLYGDMKLPWHHFQAAFILISDPNLSQFFFAPTLKGGSIETVNPLLEYRDRARSNAESPILQLLNSLRRFDATDPRDKMYALCGLSSDGMASALSPDYAASNTVLDAYHRLAVYHLETGDGVELLRCAGLASLDPSQRAVTTATLPSWVPDWRQREVPSRIASELGDAAPTKKAIVYSLSHDQRQLTLQGVVLDRISDIRDCEALFDAQEAILAQFYHDLFTEPDHADFVNSIFDRVRARAAMTRQYYVEFGERFRGCYAGQTSYISGEDLRTAFWRTLCCDQSAVGSTFVTSDFAQATPELGEAIIEYVNQNEGGSSETSAVAARQILLSTAARSWMFTEKGYIGWVPCGAQVGDAIAVLDCMPSPTVLRHVELNRYIYVGACYVHGMMPWQNSPEHEASTDITLV